MAAKTGSSGGTATPNGERTLGTVQTFYAKRGFGFIKPAEGTYEGSDKLFAHWSAITSSAKWPTLSKGMEVEFTPSVDDDGRHSAVAITLPGGEEVQVEEQLKELSPNRTQGTVKFFSPKGFGFIELTEEIDWPEKLPAGTGVYVSREELDMAEASKVSLWRGMEVEFNVYKAEGFDGISAANVTAPGGGHLVFQRPERPEGEKTERRRPPKKGKGKGKGGKNSIPEAPPGSVAQPAGLIGGPKPEAAFKVAQASKAIVKPAVVKTAMPPGLVQSANAAAKGAKAAGAIQAAARPAAGMMAAGGGYWKGAWGKGCGKTGKFSGWNPGK